MEATPAAQDPTILGMAPARGRWVLVILGMIINLCLGSIYSWSVFVKPLADYFIKTIGQQVTATDMALPFSVFLAFFALAMMIAGRFLERLGPRTTTIIGGVLTGLGWLLASTVSSVTMLCVMYGVIGGIGVGVAYGAPVAVAARWFPDKRGLAVGLTLLGFGFSALVTANLAGWLIGAYGVMSTFRIFGLAFVVLIVLLALPLSFPPAGWRPAGWSPPAPQPGSSSGQDFDRAAMLKTPTFYGLWVCYFIGCLAGLMAISIAKPVGTEVVQLDSKLATLLVGFFALFNGGGRPLFGVLTDRLNPRKTAVLSFVLIALAAVLMWQVQATWAYVLAFATLWGCLGGWLAIAPAATGSYFGTRDYPRCYGVVFLAYGAGAIVGPLLATKIKTMSGTYVGVFPYVAVLAIVGVGVAGALLRPPRR